MDVFQNNPYFKKLDLEKSFSLRCHYAHGWARQAYSWKHFASAFVDYFNKCTGMDVKLFDTKPDLYLSEEELKGPGFNIKQPYWLILAGRGSTMTTKLWPPSYYQAVIDQLAGKIQFVQIGSINDVHPKLNGVVDLTGKTSVRHMIQLVYHSDGAVCPITSLHHMAAAWDKPCVTVAGGREAPTWEAYPSNAGYLHTVGALDCCKREPCFRSDIDPKGAHPCPNVVERQGFKVAKCMDMITPEMVVDAVVNGPSRLMFRRGTWPPEGGIPPIRTSPWCAECQTNHAIFTPCTRMTPVFMDEKSKVCTTCGGHHPPTLICPRPMPVINSGVNKVNFSMGKITICACLYGGAGENLQFVGKNDQGVQFVNLHKRFLGGLLATVPHDRMELRLATNDVGEDTIGLLEDIKKKVPTIIYGPNINKLKYPRLREMFYDASNPISTEWVLVVDDDVIFHRADWLEKLESLMEVGIPKGAKVFGEHYVYYLRPENLKWHQSRPWWRGRTPFMRGPLAQVNFVCGGWWLARLADLKELDWPDPALRGNGGDVALGSAMYQREWKLMGCRDIIDCHNTPSRGINHEHPKA
jgi:ADP-heptose:LPS heptosyltransferase